MLCCSNCFTDTEIKPMIDGKKDDDNCNIKNRETGDCDFCGKKVFMYMTRLKVVLLRIILMDC